MGDDCSYCHFPRVPEDMRSALEFCSKLTSNNRYDTSKFDGLVRKIKEEVEPYYHVENDFDDASGCIAMTMQTSHSILKTIMGTKEAAAYKVYTADFRRECIEHYVATLARFIPKLFGTLYFLYFMCNKTACGRIGGGKWESSSTIRGDGNLKNWLCDKDGGTNRSKSGGLKRGFREEDLKGTDTVEALVSKESGVECLINHDNYGHLQSLMTPMIFLYDWHSGKTAHTLLFLKEFIHELHSETVICDVNIANPRIYMSGCYPCFVSIQGLFRKLHPVCKEHNVLYQHALRRKTDSFGLYYNWIRMNITSLIQSLQEMCDDCREWSLCTLNDGTSNGPLTWGFVFTDDGWINGQNESKFKPLIRRLIRDLKHFSKMMQSEEKPSASGQQQYRVVTASEPTFDELGVTQLEGTYSSNLPSVSSYATRVAIVVALGAFFFSIWYLLNI